MRRAKVLKMNLTEHFCVRCQRHTPTVVEGERQEAVDAASLRIGFVGGPHDTEPPLRLIAYSHATHGRREHVYVAVDALLSYYADPNPSPYASERRALRAALRAAIAAASGREDDRG